MRNEDQTIRQRRRLWLITALLITGIWLVGQILGVPMHFIILACLPFSIAVYALDRERFRQYSRLGQESQALAQQELEKKLAQGRHRATIQRNAIASLATDQAYINGDLLQTCIRLTEVLAEVIEVERASIWLFSEDATRFICKALHDQGKTQSVVDLVLEVSAFPRYFTALNNDSRIYANDALLDSRTSEFADIYLKPLNISAMLDAGIVVDGHLVGVICLEHRGGIRDWQADEEAFASLIATLVAQTLLNLDRLNAIDRLAYTSQWLRHVLDAATQLSIIATDAQGIITLFNKGAENLLGYSAEEMIGYQTPALIHVESEVLARGRELSAELGEPIEGFSIFVAKALSGSYEEREWTYVRKDGSQVPVSLTVTAVRNDAGEVIGLLGIALDMTERKRTQVALELRNRALALANTQAKKLINDADLANQAKSEFLASMSHEIRTPMNGVLGMLNLIGKEPLKPSQQHYLNLASSSARSLLSIINDILDFSKIDAKKLTLNPVDFDLVDLLSDIAKSMALRAQENGVSLILDLSDVEQEVVHGDPQRIRQIVTNLLGNAVKFTEQGEVLLRASLSEGKSGVSLAISVIDSGVGVPEEKKPSLFTPFSQVDSSNTRRFGGTGLGLVISKQLVELMQGHIGFESTVDQGSHFYFSIPTRPVSSKVSVELMDVNCSVLLIDGVVSSRAAILAELTLLGCRVYLADTLIDAAKKYYNKQFSLLLLDNKILKLEGPEAHVALTRTGAGGSVGIGFSATYLLVDMGYSETPSAGCQGYVHRPVARNDLREALGLKQKSLKHSIFESIGETKNILLGREIRVLLVEDNVINQQVALGLLVDLGVKVSFASNGEEAVTMVENFKDGFDLVLMDCQMPKMDGYRATEEIRKLVSVPRELPIIAMTASAMPGDRERCIAAGMNDYIPKPIEPDMLAEKVRLWLAHRIKSGASANGIRSTSSSDSVLNIPAENSKPARQRTQDANQSLNSVLMIWNERSALKRVRGRADRLQILVGLFLKDMPDRMASLNKALGDRRYSDIAELAHLIKGVAGNLSAERLAHSAHDLQALCTHTNPLEIKVAQTVSTLTVHFNELVSTLNNYMSGVLVDP